MRQEAAAAACRLAPQAPLGASRNSKWLGEGWQLTVLGVRGGSSDMGRRVEVLPLSGEALGGRRHSVVARHDGSMGPWTAEGGTVSRHGAGHGSRLQRRVSRAVFAAAQVPLQRLVVAARQAPRREAHNCVHSAVAAVVERSKGTRWRRGTLDSGTGDVSDWGTDVGGSRGAGLGKQLTAAGAQGGTASRRSKQARAQQSAGRVAVEVEAGSVAVDVCGTRMFRTAWMDCRVFSRCGRGVARRGGRARVWQDWHGHRWHRRISSRQPRAPSPL
jgi:hypothetical protein